MYEEAPILKSTIIRHTRSIHNNDDNSDREVTIQDKTKTLLGVEHPIEGTIFDCVVQEDTQMTPEELVTFENEWKDLWKPQSNPQFE